MAGMQVTMMRAAMVAPTTAPPAPPSSLHLRSSSGRSSSSHAGGGHGSSNHGSSHSHGGDHKHSSQRDDSWQVVHTPKLTHRHRIAHAPHAHKNLHIKTGYLVHTSWRAAAGDLFTLHNETANIVTAWVGLGVAAYLAWVVSATAEGATLLPEYRAWVLRYAAGCSFNSALVTLYHVFNTIPAWYDVLSALDLLAISGCALACVGSTLLTPGASVMRDLLSSPAGEGRAAKAVVEGALRPLVAVVAPQAAAAMPPWEALYWVVAVYTVVVGVFVTVRRMLIPGESPKWALMLNVLPVTLACLDHCLARPLWWSPLGLVTLVAGGVLYAMKLPERWVTFTAADHPAATRLIDLAGHSHMVWHLMYGTTFAVTGAGILAAALRASAAAAGTAAVPA